MEYRKDYGKDREAAWGFGSTILCRMCLENGAHTDADVVAGKMSIIGRTLAASPQRGSGEKYLDQQQDGFFTDLANAIIKSDIDQKLDTLSESNRFNDKNRAMIVAIHSGFESTIYQFLKLRAYKQKPGSKSTNGAKHQVSFASKYLHFHRPDHFPLFDSVVSKAIAQKQGIKRKRFPNTGKYDLFCQKMLVYLEDKGPDFTLRNADKALYEEGQK